MELSVEVAGKHPLEAAQRFSLALPAVKQTGVVGRRFGVELLPRQCDPVQRAVQLPVATPVEAMTLDRSARGLDRTRAGERGKGCLRTHPARFAARDDQLRGTDRTHTALGEQLRRECGHDLSDPALCFDQLAAE